MVQSTVLSRTACRACSVPLASDYHISAITSSNQEIGAGQKQEPQIDLASELRSRLPQGTDVKAVMDGWVNKNARRLFDEMGSLRPEMQSLYLKNPEAGFHIYPIASVPSHPRTQLSPAFFVMGLCGNIRQQVSSARSSEF